MCVSIHYKSKVWAHPTIFFCDCHDYWHPTLSLMASKPHMYTHGIMEEMIKVKNNWFHIEILQNIHLSQKVYLTSYSFLHDYI